MQGGRLVCGASVSFVFAVVLGATPAACRSDTEVGRISDSGTIGDGAGDDAAYSYPGCAPPANGGCLELEKTLSCAALTIEREHAACSTAADCVAAPVIGGCSGLGICDPYVVGKDAAAAFVDEMPAEIARFCDVTHCHVAPQCGGQSLTFVCVNGSCATTPCESGTCDWSD